MRVKALPLFKGGVVPTYAVGVHGVSVCTKSSRGV